MSLRTHLVTYWPHYSLGSILVVICSKIDVIWEKTEWLRAMVGWVDSEKKRKPKRKRK